jgi:hypothetical protein
VLFNSPSACTGTQHTGSLNTATIFFDDSGIIYSEEHYEIIVIDWTGCNSRQSERH